MLNEPKYCAGCGQLIPDSTIGGFLLNVIVKQPKAYKLDGKDYCQTCAKIVVEKKRKKL